MSNDLAKYLNSRRRYRDETNIKKQVKIAKQNGLTNNDRAVKEPHRLAKRHVMNCGNPKCVMCMNPRKSFKELTQQEKRLFQDAEALRDKHSNGLVTQDSIE